MQEQSINQDAMKRVQEVLIKANKENHDLNMSPRTRFLEGCKSQIMPLVKKGYSISQIYKLIKPAGYPGSYQTLRVVIAKWKEEEEPTTITENKVNKPIPTAQLSEPKLTPKSPEESNKRSNYDKKMNI